MQSLSHQPQKQQIFWGFQGKLGRFMRLPAWADWLISCITCLMPRLMQFVFQRTWPSTGEVRIPPVTLQYQHGSTLPPQCSHWVLVSFQMLWGRPSGPHKLWAVTTKQQCKRRKHHDGCTHRLTQFMKRIFRRKFQMQRARRLHHRGAAVLGGEQRLRRKVREAGTSSMRIPSNSKTNFKVTW